MEGEHKGRPRMRIKTLCGKSPGRLCRPHNLERTRGGLLWQKPSTTPSSTTTTCTMPSERERDATTLIARPCGLSTAFSATWQRRSGPSAPSTSSTKGGDGGLPLAAAQAQRAHGNASTQRPLTDPLCSQLPVYGSFGAPRGCQCITSRRRVGQRLPACMAIHVSAVAPSTSPLHVQHKVTVDMALSTHSTSTLPPTLSPLSHLSHLSHLSLAPQSSALAVPTPDPRPRLAPPSHWSTT